MTYDDQNIFARILRGELPAIKVYEDDQVLAFMDIMPQADGHTLVVPNPCNHFTGFATRSGCLYDSDRTESCKSH